MQIEIKVKINTSSTVRQKIESLGAKFWKKTKETDTYFTSKRGVFKLKQADTNECLLIHDFRPKESITTALRTELPMESVFSEKLIAILEDAVGIQLVLQREREQYIYHGFLLAVDSIKNHDTFLELTSDEISEDRRDLEKQKLLDLLSQFGFSEKDLETKSYVDMYV
ncbi:MAG TPA: class IV adenylate cyclase [Patescibacteria group bacterium]|nr:class IV adenylate cyclase [Patescibacteria group bacterium]